MKVRSNVFGDYGLIQLLSGQIMNLIGLVVVVLLLRWLVVSFLVRESNEDEGKSVRRYANLLAMAIILIGVVALLLRAGSIATNEIPRTGFDRGQVLEEATE